MKRNAPVEVALGVIGLEPNYFAVFVDRLLQFPAGLQGIAQVVMGLDVIRLESDGRAKLGSRVLQLSLGTQGRGELIMAEGATLA